MRWRAGPVMAESPSATTAIRGGGGGITSRGLVVLAICCCFGAASLTAGVVGIAGAETAAVAAVFAAVATGVVTQIAKFSFARARPFAYYANDYSNPDSRMSFFSGHTSYSFALSISSAMLLADAYPKYRLLIYTVAFFVASIPGYLRIAADKHYFTDVFAGAVVGSSLAYGVVRLQMTGTTSQYGDERQLQLQRVFFLQ